MLNKLKKIKEKWFLEVVQPDGIQPDATEKLNGFIGNLFASSPGTLWNFYVFMEGRGKSKDVESMKRGVCKAVGLMKK
jgi:hypothetical protein